MSLCDDKEVKFEGGWGCRGRFWEEWGSFLVGGGYKGGEGSRSVKEVGSNVVRF